MGVLGEFSIAIRRETARWCGGGRGGGGGGGGGGSGRDSGRGDREEEEEEELVWQPIEPVHPCLNKVTSVCLWGEGDR
ncbi:hypothetical protein HZH68_003508 [Vespula germanica]|uniref:Uncharacterized protein n=1 Tax=Vespula germanica TaxID=30212 RepID=A0A834U3A0_VESGE|nr:hypothetical protein HZH68_003508 [Vespula germanica]